MPQSDMSTHDERDDDVIVVMTTSVPLLYLVAEVVVAILAVFENFMIILVFVLNRKLRTVANYYVITLAVADLLVGLFGIPAAIATSLGYPRRSPKVTVVLVWLQTGLVRGCLDDAYSLYPILFQPCMFIIRFGLQVLVLCVHNLVCMFWSCVVMIWFSFF